MRQEAAPPRVLRLVSDPVRWRLLAELASSDRQVRELQSLTGLRQSLVSYHLGPLRAGGLVSVRCIRHSGYGAPQSPERGSGGDGAGGQGDRDPDGRGGEQGEDDAPAQRQHQDQGAG
jgi:Bacterial regulatory protein, arsR family